MPRPYEGLCFYLCLDPYALSKSSPQQLTSSATLWTLFPWQQHSFWVPQNVTTQCSSPPTFKNKRPGDCKYHTLCLAHHSQCFSSRLGQVKTSGSLYAQAAAMAKAAPIPLGLGYNETWQLGESCPSQYSAFWCSCLLILGPEWFFTWAISMWPTQIQEDEGLPFTLLLFLLFCCLNLSLCLLPRSYAHQEGKQLSQTSL